MDWPEIKRRLTKENTSVQILADLEGVPYKTMYQRIKWHERQDGKKYMPEMKTKKKKQAEAEKVGREIVEGLPKFEADPEKKEERPEVVPDFMTKKLHIPEEKPDIPEDVYTNERKLMPETIEEILAMYKQCCELADRYTKQAEDWARIMKLLQLEESERIRRT